MKSTTTSVNISMPASLKKAMHKRMAAAGFENASEYVRHLIREDTGEPSAPTVRSLAELKRELIRGLRSGPAVEFTPKMLDAIRRKIATPQSARKKSA